MTNRKKLIDWIKVKNKKKHFFPFLSQVSKTLKATLTALLDSICESDCNPTPDVPSSLSHEPPGGGTAPKLTLAKRRANQQETETYYFTVSYYSFLQLELTYNCRSSFKAVVEELLASFTLVK